MVNQYWVHPAFKDVFMLVTKRYTFGGIIKIKGHWLNCGFVGKPYMTHIMFNLRMNFHKYREFKKFPCMQDAYNCIRGNHA